jgi:hypothetical protein
MAPFWISRHFEISTKENLIYHLKAFLKCIHLLNRLANAITIGQKRYCSRWRHLGLATILKCQTSEISYIILRLFQKVFIF